MNSERLKESMLASIALLRAMHHISWTLHWQARGEAFYANHQMFEFIYKGLGKSLDALSEHLVLLYGFTAVNPVVSWEQAGRWILSLGALHQEQDLEQALYDFSEELAKILDHTFDLAGKASPYSGLQNLLGGIAEQNEKNRYMLRQHRPTS
jgi:DNA-binding ferritin-like protein